MSAKKNNVLSDIELISLIRNGSEKAFNLLIRQYSGLVSAMCSRYYSPFFSREDWFQEGMIGLLDAVRSYSTNGTAAFSTYAAICIKNRLNSVLKKNSAMHFDAELSVLQYSHELVSAVESPEASFIQNESYGFFTKSFSELLSKTEQQVFKYYLSGYSYKEIAYLSGICEKSVDNALCRAKQKLKKAFKK